VLAAPLTLFYHNVLLILSQSEAQGDESAMNRKRTLGTGESGEEVGWSYGVPALLLLFYVKLSNLTHRLFKYVEIMLVCGRSRLGKVGSGLYRALPHSPPVSEDDRRYQDQQHACRTP
jgi:hypothetical protein